ncbi:MAG: hypothetical protein ABI921_03750 [Panacibacter sp.]
MFLIPDARRNIRNNRGALNIIDLANAYRYTFIATDDVCEIYDDGSLQCLAERKEVICVAAG